MASSIGAFRRKTAATCAVVALSALAISSPAKALDFNWSFLNNFGSPSMGGTTTGKITGLVEGVNDVSTGGIFAIITTSQNGAAPFSISGDSYGSGSVTVSNGSVTSYNFIFDDFNNGQTFYAKLGDSAFYDGIGVSDKYNGPNNIFASSGPASVPGPLPILGASAAFGWSRRLRKRIGHTAVKSC